MKPRTPPGVSVEEAKESPHPTALLPDEDEEEAYCFLHGRWMDTVPVMIHRQGGLYRTGDNFDIYQCQDCVKLMAHLTDDDDVTPDSLLWAWMAEYFRQWDNGESLGDWFKFVREGSMESAQEEENVTVLDPEITDDL